METVTREREIIAGLRDQVLRELWNYNQGSLPDWLKASVSVPGEPPASLIRLADNEATRTLLRMMVNNVIAYRRAPERVNPYRHELRKLRLVNSRKTASAATQRFLKVAEWSDADDGPDAADTYTSAGRLAEMLMEHYCGWQPTETPEDVSGLYLSALEGAFDDQAREAVLRLLEDLGRLANGKNVGMA